MNDTAGGNSLSYNRNPVVQGFLAHETPFRVVFTSDHNVMTLCIGRSESMCAPPRGRYGTVQGGWTAYLDQRAVDATTCDSATFGEPGGDSLGWQNKQTCFIVFLVYIALKNK